MMTGQRGLEAGQGLIQMIRLLLRWVEVILFCHPLLSPINHPVSSFLPRRVLLAPSETPLNPQSALHTLRPFPAVPCLVAIHVRTS